MSSDSAIATAIVVVDQVLARHGAGALRAIKTGDILYAGDTIVTGKAGYIELAFNAAPDDAPHLNIQSGDVVTLSNELIASLHRLHSRDDTYLLTHHALSVLPSIVRDQDIDDTLEAPAAGLASLNGVNAYANFVRLEKINEAIQNTVTLNAHPQSAVIPTALTNELPIDDNTRISSNIDNAPINPAPVNTLPGSVSVNEDSGVRITGLSIADIDSSEGMSVTLSATNGLLFINGGSATVDNNLTAAVTLTGTVAQINLTLAAMIFYFPNQDFNGNEQITMTTSDGGTAVSNVFTITVNSMNDAPLIHIPDSLITIEDSMLNITGLSITDVDTDGTDMVVHLAVAHGNITVNGGSATITNNGTNDVRLSGTLAAINSTLSGTVIYTPSANFNGADQLAITTVDYGNGNGNTYTISSLAEITISGVNDAPVVPETSLAIAENSGPLTGNILDDAHDPEGQAMAVSGIVFDGITYPAGTTVTGVYGTLIIDANGNYTYTVDSAHADDNGLPLGQSATDDFTIIATDGSATSSSGLAINVTGNGEASPTLFTGSDANDVVLGSTEKNLIVGGPGSDTLTGDLGSDIFKWGLNDHGSANHPDLDIVTDFNNASRAAGGDVLDLRDLLQGENHQGHDASNLANYLHFEQSGGDTIVHISTAGDGQADLTIALQNVDLVSSFANDSQIIHDLLTRGKLITD